MKNPDPKPDPPSPDQSGPSDMKAGGSEFPPPGSDFKEEKEKHEEEAGADVQDYAQTHVHAVKAQTQNPNASSGCSSTYSHNLLFLLLLASLMPSSKLQLIRLLVWLLPFSSPVLLLRLVGLCRIRFRRRSWEVWRSH